jgi:hypothetical protein
MGYPPEDRRPLVERIPPTNVASPSELRPRDPNDVRWYKPGFEETLKLMGWRWIFFLPGAALLLLIFFTPRYIWFSQLIVVYWKLIVIAVGLPLGVFLQQAKHSVKMRKEPFCIHCGYDLTSLPDNYTCPECGEPFSHRVIEEYRRDPDWFIERFKKRHDIPVADVPFAAGNVVRKKSRDGT